MGYSNGRVPASALVTVEDNDQLTQPAASAYLAMKAAAARDGVTLFIVEPAGAYRSFEVQTDMHVHPERYNLNPDNIVTLAKPGYSSHGFGDRFDLNAAAIKWAIANGPRFGVTREFGAADPNHFKHDGVTVVGGGVGGFRPKEKTMSFIVPLVAGNPPSLTGRSALVSASGKVTEDATTSTLISQAKRLGIPVGETMYRQAVDLVAAALAPGAVTVTIDDETAAAIAAQMDVPTEQEIAEAVVDEQAERLAQ